MVRPIALALLLATAALPLRADAAPAVPAAVRTLAVIPFYGPERMWQLYAPFIEFLRSETGEAWELKLYPNHESMVAGVCRGEVDVALLGPAPLGKVNRACGAAPFLVPLGRDGKPVYHAMLLTTDPEVTSVAGLRGRKFGFFKGSTAAHVLPLKMLRDAGLGPGSFEPVFFESQDRIMTALLGRQIAGAGVKEALYRRFEAEPLRLLQTSEDLPNFAFAALPSQPAERRKRFLEVLLKLKPHESAAAAAITAAWDDEIKNGFMLPGPDFLPAVLRVEEIGRTTMDEAR